jgi:ribA/ribD-fused uncharacterized protein
MIKPMDKPMNMKNPIQVIQDNKIEFYKAGNINGFYSNLFPAPFTDKENSYWPTSEHYYQAHKFVNNLEIMEELRNIKKPRDVAFAGRLKSPIISTWEEDKDSVMKRAIRYKFEQNEQLKQCLIESGTAEIIEVTQHDKYWGNGGDNSGLNKLGKFLMELRSEL